MKFFSKQDTEFDKKLTSKFLNIQIPAISLPKFENSNQLKEFIHPYGYIRTNFVSFASLHMTERNPYGRTSFVICFLVL